jgi:glycosyltransferase involved in cell wall biosynthesis
MRSVDRIAILLATYNGEKYLDQQIRSLIAQTYRDFVVIARDDHSGDRTLEILTRWSAAWPDKINVVSDNCGNLGLLGNFSRLMQVCDAPYFAFCDQDDIWLPNKLDLMVNEIKRLEAQVGIATPILVHSDLTIVDEKLQHISPSLFCHRRINIERDVQLRYLIFTNVAVGCASMGNRALLALARPIPEKFPVHDWWVALVASSCGLVRTIEQPTVLYRQHGRNQIGAGPVHGRSMLWDARHILRRPKKLGMRLTRAMRMVQFQSDLLLRIAGNKMPRHNREFLRAFCFPQNRDEAAVLTRSQRTWLVVRFLSAYLRALPVALRWCY